MNFSRRSEALITTPSPIVVGHLKCIENPYTSKNPDGHLNFGTAENDLMTDVLMGKLSQKIEVDHDMVHYGMLHGGKLLRDTFCHFANAYLDINLYPDDLVIQNGVSSLCESLSYCLLDPGDEIMIFSPYYSGFDFDFSGRFQGKIISIPLSPTDNYYHHIHLLEETYHSHRKIKALVICNPHNPTGRILTDREIIDIINWCKKNDIHLISDEIYALSMIRPQKKFKSFLHPSFPDYENLHFLYGMAKDFALGGYKVGFFASKNEDLLKRMATLSYFHCVGSHNQKVVAELLSDKHFLGKYISENQEKLSSAFTKIQNAFPHFVTPEAGLFCYTPLHCEATNTAQQEQLDWKELLDNFRINILPGSAFHDAHHGFFRICFARPDNFINEFIERFNRFKSS